MPVPRARPVHTVMFALVPVALVLVGSACSTGSDTARTSTEGSDTMATSPLLGLRTAGYHVADLAAAKAWYTELLGYGPYFDEAFYVGFDVGGYELGLNPDTSNIRPGAGGTVLYWGVADADAVHARLLELGATGVVPVEDVGGGIRHAVVRDPFDNLFGIIENPHFQGGR
jgi:predicted enzyme related to lactoylglutathione lyase